MLVQKLKTDFEFVNEVGSLVQLVHEGWSQINVLKSVAGSVRGGHFHKENREAFYMISGKLKLSLEFNDEYEETVFESGEMFLISPFQKHSFEFLEDTVMVSMYDLGVEYEDGTKDIYTEM